MTDALRPPRRRRRNWGFVRPIVLTLSLLFICFWTVAPILWIVIMSVQKEINYIAVPMQLKWSDVDLAWYRKVLDNDEYRKALKNSVIISTSTMICCLILGSLAAYPLARLRMPRKNLFIIVVVGIHMLPGIALIIPVFLLVRQINANFPGTGVFPNGEQAVTCWTCHRGDPHPSSVNNKDYGAPK